MKASLGQRLRKGLWVVLGSILLTIGLIGIVVPLLPTTPFLLLAAGCYAKGSKRLSDRLLANPWLGPYLHATRDGSPLTWRWRVASMAFLWTSIALTIVFLTENLAVRAALVVIALLVTLHLATVGRKRTRKTLR